MSSISDAVSASVDRSALIQVDVKRLVGQMPARIFGKFPSRRATQEQITDNLVFAGQLIVRDKNASIYVALQPNVKLSENGVAWLFLGGHSHRDEFLRKVWFLHSGVERSRIFEL
jgi:hypothetical protein